jgi:hypothetical protein
LIGYIRPEIIDVKAGRQTLHTGVRGIQIVVERMVGDEHASTRFFLAGREVRPLVVAYLFECSGRPAFECRDDIRNINLDQDYPRMVGLLG